MNDIYFESKYGFLYENIENGTCEVYEFQHLYGKIRHMFIKRPFYLKSMDEVFYDITTPYGYGGPEITNCEEVNKSKVVQAFCQDFKEYCKKEKIISEFVRFHPLLENAQDFKECYDLTFRRYTTGTNLKDYEDPIKSEFSKSKQKSIQKAIKAGVEYRVIVNPPNLIEFKHLYYETMNRRGAASVYYFDDAYFEGLLNSFGPNIVVVEVLYEGKIIASGLNFAYGKYIHIHLSGTLQEYQGLSSAFVMRYALVLWGKERGMELIHEGGGLTGKLDDPLYLFKKQFGKNTEFSFYVSYKIWNQKVYDILCESIGVDKEHASFPAYRSAPLKLVKE